MSKLTEELKKKYKTPQEAMAALGLDAALLEPPKLANDSALPKMLNLFTKERTLGDLFA